MRTLSVALAAILATQIAGAAQAHEYVAVPTTPRIAAGAMLQIEGYSTHSLLNAEEVERLEASRVRLVHGSTRTEVTMQADEGRLLQVGSAPAPTGSTFIVAGNRTALTFATTPRGSQRGTKLDHPDAVRAGRFEKFSKALVNLSPTDQGYAQVLGDRLEIVPLANPATLRVGDEIAVRVLFEGQPLAAQVFATHQGFSTRPDTYAQATLSLADGTAHVRLTTPGLWLIRVEHRLTPANTREIDTDVTRAILAFHVN